MNNKTNDTIIYKKVLKILKKIVDTVFAFENYDGPKSDQDMTKSMESFAKEICSITPPATQPVSVSESVVELIQSRIKELKEADGKACEKQWNMSLSANERGIWREQSNEITGRRHELEDLLRKLKTHQPTKIDLVSINQAIEDFKKSEKWDEVDLDEEEGFPVGFECGVTWALKHQPTKIDEGENEINTLINVIHNSDLLSDNSKMDYKRKELIAIAIAKLINKQED